MCTITVRDTGMDIPENECSNCEMKFNICWNNLKYDQPEYCPFCGEEIVEYIYENFDDN